MRMKCPNCTRNVSPNLYDYGNGTLFYSKNYMRDFYIMALVDIHLQPANVWQMGESLPFDADCPYQAMETSQGT